MIEPPGTSEPEGHVVQIQEIGDSLGMILPKDLIARLGLKEGDKVHLMEQAERGIKLTPYDPKHAKVMGVARQVMDEYKDTFRDLAK